jgi:hypothetical protein
MRWFMQVAKGLFVLACSEFYYLLFACICVVALSFSYELQPPLIYNQNGLSPCYFQGLKVSLTSEARLGKSYCPSER